MTEFDMKSSPASVLYGRGMTDGLPSTDVTSIINEGLATLATFRKEAADTRRAALDPAISGEAVQKALQSASALDFESDRIENTIARLRERVVALEKVEAASRDRAAFDAARRARDEAVEGLRRYPEIAEQIVEILVAVQQANAAVTAANRAIPDGEDRLDFAEMVARGVRFNEEESVGLVANVRLPSPDPRRGVTRPLWPQTNGNVLAALRIA